MPAPVCDRNCDVNNPSNYRPDATHYLNCPVWVVLMNHGSDD